MSCRRILVLLLAGWVEEGVLLVEKVDAVDRG